MMPSTVAAHLYRTAVRRVLVALALALLARGAAEAQQPQQFTGYVSRVVDGDTIYVVIGNEIEAVRYIGINTPETHHPSKGREPFGEAATAVNQQLVDGKWVTLVLDTQHRDRYGRLLAYVWVDGRFVNAELVHRGYAQAATYPPNVRYAEYFRQLEAGAREANRGLWYQTPTSATHRRDQDKGRIAIPELRMPRGVRMKNPETDTAASSRAFSAPVPRDAPIMKSDGQSRTEHVRGYRRDDGTVVQPYYRNPGR
jgi:micrococcal nuclease